MIRVGDAANAPAFPVAAKGALGNTQLRRNVRHATNVIRGKRAIVVGEMADWEQLRVPERGFRCDRKRRRLRSIANPNHGCGPPPARISAMWRQRTSCP